LKKPQIFIENRKILYSSKELSFILYNLSINKQKQTREILKQNGVCAILALKKNKIILEKQYRFPRGYVYEIPAGTMEKSETPIKCARRELKEETGYQAKKMDLLIKYYPSIHFSTELVYCFLASNIKKSNKQKLESDEIISVLEVDIKKVIKMILTGKIIDSKTICAVLTYATKNKLFF